MIEIDARGLDCPQPVIDTKKELEKGEAVLTLVDNEIAVSNLQKLAKKFAYETEVSKVDEDFEVKFYPTGEVVTSSITSAISDDSQVGENKVYFIRSDVLGKGERELGEFLIKGFIYTLLETSPLPQAIIFINSGVKLPTQNEEIIENLELLAESGVEIISCGACLDYYALEEELAVGEISNMYAIVDLLNSYSVVTV